MARAFDTSRLNVDEPLPNISECEKDHLYTEVLKILTPAVVENLPDYFHGISSTEDAANWFEWMTSESRLLIVSKSDAGEVIGFVFVYTDVRDAHIGYLLGETFWRLGYAKELLSGFIEWSKREAVWDKLIGGVDTANISSSCLLKRLGFTDQLPIDGSTVFYTYDLIDLSI